jgi:hypothetical protein
MLSVGRFHPKPHQAPSSEHDQEEEAVKIGYDAEALLYEYYVVKVVLQMRV